MLSFILKVFILSAGLSAAIKYMGPLLNLPISQISSLIAVFLPSIGLAIALYLRSLQPSQSEDLSSQQDLSSQK